MRLVSRLTAAAGMVLLLLAGCQRPAEKPREASQPSWLIDASAFYASPHGDLECSECHSEALTGNETFPHGRGGLERGYELDPKSCERCHPAAARDQARGVHAKAAQDEERALEQGLEPASLTGSIYHAPRCYDCHPIHYRLQPGEE